MSQLTIRMKDQVQNILLLLTSLFLLFSLMEIGVRIYLTLSPVILYPLRETYVENPDSEQTFSAELGWVLKPQFHRHGIQVNSLGMRSSQDFDFGRTTRKKVLLLGDSMVFGYGVSQESIFSELLNREYREVIFANTGANGYSTWQGYLVLKKYVEQIKPAVVILFYTQENDMFENSRRVDFYPGVSLKNGRLISGEAKKDNKQPFYKKSMAYRLLNRKVLHEKNLTYAFQKVDFQVRKENSYVWVIARRILHEVAQIRDQRKFSFVVIDIPTQNQLRNPQMSRVRQALLRKAAQEEHFFYYDLLDFYSKDYESLFLSNDPHWNSKGHRFIANLVKEILSSNRLI